LTSQPEFESVIINNIMLMRKLTRKRFSKMRGSISNDLVLSASMGWSKREGKNQSELADIVESNNR